MEKLPSPRIVEVSLKDLHVDHELNPRDSEEYRIEDMKDLLVTAGALNDMPTVHRNGKDGFTVLCGSRRVSTLQVMFEEAEDKAAWSKQWEPIICQAYENLEDEQIRFIVNDHGARLGLNKVGIWRGFKQSQQLAISVSDYVDANWHEIASACKTPNSKAEAEKRIDNAPTDVERRKIRCATVKQHTDIMRFVFRVLEAGASNLEAAYLLVCKGRRADAPILLEKKAWSDLANKATEDAEAGRKPMAPKSSYRQYWDQLVKEKKEKDEKKESDEPDPERGLKQATKAEIASAKRQCKTQLARDCMDLCNGDKTMLSRILEREKSTMDLNDLPMILAPVWEEVRKIKDGVKAGGVIVGHLTAAIAEQRLQEEESE
jgi:hypothetical protein